jgi:ATP-dependent DNA ligase
MQPTLVREPFHRAGWIFEEKLDGWRIVAFKDGRRVRLISRQGVDHTERCRAVDRWRKNRIRPWPSRRRSGR